MDFNPAKIRRIDRGEVMGKLSREKGKRGERELVGKLREHGFADAHRSQQFSGKGESAADVIALPAIHIECKRVERLNISDAMAQAKRDAKNGDKPAVFHRKNGEGWLVTMQMDDWIEIYREFYSGTMLNESEG